MGWGAVVAKGGGKVSGKVSGDFDGVAAWGKSAHGVR